MLLLFLSGSNGHFDHGPSSSKSENPSARAVLSGGVTSPGLLGLSGFVAGEGWGGRVTPFFKSFFFFFFNLFGYTGSQLQYMDSASLQGLQDLIFLTMQGWNLYPPNCKADS